MANATISGKDASGTVGTLTTDIASWSLDYKTNSKKYASSATGGKKKTISTIEEWDMTLVIFSDGDHGLVAGSTVAVDMKTDGTKNYTGNAVIDSYTTDNDIEGGELTKYTFALMGDATLTFAVT